MSDQTIQQPGLTALARERLTWLVGLGVVLACLLGILLVAPLKDDIAWLLYVADNCLNGSRLYIDLIEVNPPLVIWLYAIPMAIARVLHLAAVTTTMPFLMALVLGCAGWTAAILADGRAWRMDRVKLFVVIALVLCLVPGGEFGQREHLLVAAALPWLAVLARQLEGMPTSRAEAIGAAVLAAVGCVLKPHYLLAFGAVELLALLHGLRPWRPEVLAGAATALLYTAMVLLLEPAFLRDAVPMAFTIYGASDVPLSEMLADCRLPLLTACLGTAMLAVIRWRHRSAALDARMMLPSILLLFAAGATAVCIIQGKNWFYHRIPGTIAALLFLLAWLHVWAPVLLERARARTARASLRPLLRPALAVAPALLLLGLFTLDAGDRLRLKLDRAIYSADSTEARLEALIRKYNAHSYLAFSDWIALGFPVVNNTHVRWASRFDSTWALDGEVLESRQPGGAKSGQTHGIASRMSSDFRRSCPDLVVVDRRTSIDYVGALAHADPGFLAIWRSYDRVAAFDGLVVFKRRVSADHRTGCTPLPPPRQG